MVKGNGFTILIFQLIRQKNILISRISRCICGRLSVNDLGSQSRIIHCVNAVVTIFRNRITPQSHGSLGSIAYVPIILPLLYSTKIHLTRNTLGYGAIVVTQSDVVTIISSAVAIGSLVGVNGSLGNGVVLSDGSLHHYIIIFLIGVVISGKVRYRYTPCIIIIFVYRDTVHDELIAAVSCTAVQFQRQVVRTLIVRIVTIHPGDGGIEGGRLTVCELRICLIG